MTKHIVIYTLLHLIGINVILIIRRLNYNEQSAHNLSKRWYVIVELNVINSHKYSLFLYLSLFESVSLIWTPAPSAHVSIRQKVMTFISFT